MPRKLGRKPKGTAAGVPFSLRLAPDLRNELARSARTRGRPLSEEIIGRLRLSLAKDLEEQRDPALKALNFVIAQLAERISSGMYMADREARLEFQKDWRTDPFKFGAFKFAVGKLLDALDPPPPERESVISEEKLAAIKERASQEAMKGFGPELQKLLIEIKKTPETYGAFSFGALWTQLTRTNPLTEKEKEMALRYPSFGEVIEREFYGFEKARRDLGIDIQESRRKAR